MKQETHDLYQAMKSLYVDFNDKVMEDYMRLIADNLLTESQRNDVYLDIKKRIQVLKEQE